MKKILPRDKVRVEILSLRPQMQVTAAHARIPPKPVSVRVARAAPVHSRIASHVNAERLFKRNFSQACKNERLLLKPAVLPSKIEFVRLDKYVDQRTSKNHDIRIKMDPTQRRHMASLSSGFTEQPFKIQLITTLESVSKWPQKEGLEKQETIWRFMDAVGNLYMDYFHKHLAEASECAQSHKEILKQHFDDIVVLYVIELMFKLANVDEQFDDPWDKACRGRTNIEAFNAMFGKFVDKLPTEEIEEFMDSRKELAWLPPNEIPPNAPKSHWWWYQGQPKN